MQCSEQNMGMNISGILILAYYTYHVLYHVIYTLDYIQCILCVQTCVHIYIFFVRAYIYKYMHANIKLAMYVCACICIYIYIQKIYVYVYQCCCSQYCTQHVTYFSHIHQYICIYTYTWMLYCIQHTNTCSITYMCIYNPRGNFTWNPVTPILQRYLGSPYGGHILVLYKIRKKSGCNHSTSIKSTKHMDRKCLLPHWPTIKSKCTKCRFLKRWRLKVGEPGM